MRKASSMMKGLDRSPLCKIEVPDALPGHLNVEPRDLRPVSAYDWTDSARPTIIVPGTYIRVTPPTTRVEHLSRCSAFADRFVGHPRIWKNRKAPFFVPRDSGKAYIDINKYKVPDYPLLPLFTAVDHLDPRFPFTSMDIITDRNNLRKLMRFVEGSFNKKKGFRIDLQLIGKSTVLFGRHEERAMVRAGQEWGHSFERVTTKPFTGCNEGISHHRIVTYVSCNYEHGVYEDFLST